MVNLRKGSVGGNPRTAVSSSDLKNIHCRVVNGVTLIVMGLRAVLKVSD